MIRAAFALTLNLVVAIGALASGAISEVVLPTGPGQNVPPVRVAEMEYLGSDDESAVLDALAFRLVENATLVGFIVGHNGSGVPHGKFLRRVLGDRRYLIRAKGIDEDRIVVLDGGGEKKYRTELWVAPKGSLPVTGRPPNATTEIGAAALLYDRQCTACDAAVPI